MSWIQNLCDTYDACTDYVGICGDNQEKMLLPMGHLLSEIDLIIYLSSNGKLQRPERINQKQKLLICIPCTDDSEGRSSSGAINYPHPLSDQIKYLLTQNYMKNLYKWINYLNGKEEHLIAYKALSAVYCYITKGTILQDLKNYQIPAKEDMLVGFCVTLDDSLENRLWRMPELWKAWTDYYLSENINKRTTKDICYITGLDNSPYTNKHPKSINRSSGNAKLITGNDEHNFTFRGRFEVPSQALTVSYTASQKAHQVLRWLLSINSCYRKDTQAIIAWAIDRQPDVLPFYYDSYSIYQAISESDEEKKIDAKSHVFSDYATMMKNAITGRVSLNKLQKHNRHIAILATDATTKNTGRMSITYYRELFENEYEECIEKWHNTCKWYQPFGKGSDGKIKPGYFIGAPAFESIMLAVLGKRRKQKDESYDKCAKNLREQLVHCIFDGERIPSSMVIAALNHASNPLVFENPDTRNSDDRWRDWEYVLGAASALIKKYYHDKKEEFAVKLEIQRNDRDYLYGRLLAVADKIESHARFKQGKSKDDARITNAIRYMSAFSQHPFHTWNLLFTQQLTPYIQQLDGADWYLNLIGDIKELFKPGEFENNTALDGRYLLGFFAQRQVLRKKSENNNNMGGENNEFTEQN